MSRIGKKPIILPQGVDARIEGRVIAVKGPKGELKWDIPMDINVSRENGSIIVQRTADTKRLKSLHGLTRNIIANMVTGVHEGYQKMIEITGVGYKAQLQKSQQNEKLVIALGYSHPVEFVLPQGIRAHVDPKQTKITLEGFDKQLLGQVAANLRALRPPDIYKGKGVRYAGEKIKLKAGKAGKK